MMRNRHMFAIVAAAAAAAGAASAQAGVLFRDTFETSTATPFTLAQQIANPALQTDSDPNNTYGGPGQAGQGDWFHYAKTTTAPFNIQVTNNVDFTATGSYEGSNVLRLRRSPEPPSSTSAMAAYIGQQSAGTIRANWLMMFPDQYTLPLEPFGITFPVHFFFTPYADNDHSDGTSPDGQKTPVVVLDNPQETPRSYGRTYFGGVAQTFPPGSGSVAFNNAGDPVVTPNKWQRWTLEANIDTGMFTFGVDGITTPPQPFNFPGGFSALTFRVGQAQAQLDPNINGIFYLDDLTIERLDPRWNVNADGNWTNPANWDRPVPNAVGAGADFLGAIQTPHTVTVDAPITVGLMTFDNANSYTIAGANTLTIDNVTSPATVTVLNGNHTISAPVHQADTTIYTVSNPAASLTMSGTLTFGGGVDVIKNGPGRLDMLGPRVANTVINGGTLRLVPNGTAAGRGYSITVDLEGGASPTASLDVTNNAYVFDYQTDSPLNGVIAQLQSAYAGGAWSGNGIKTSMGGSFGVGYGEITEFGGTAPPIFGPTNDTMVLLRGTLYGDANIDGVVNISDFALLGANFNTPGTWSKGDFNYDMTVGIGDFAQLAANFNQVAATGRSPVPEPTGVAMGLLAGAMLAGRRRGR